MATGGGEDVCKAVMLAGGLGTRPESAESQLFGLIMKIYSTHGMKSYMG